MGDSDAGATSSPRSPRSAPTARWAATGEKMSLPWKLLETGWRWYSGLVSNTARADPAKGLGGGQEQTVVRPYQVGPATRLGGELPPCRLVFRIYDRQIHRVVGHVPGGVPQRLGPPDHVELGDAVGHVYDGDSGRNAHHHALADPHELAGETVV